MSPRSPYRHRDSFSMTNRPRSPAPTLLQTSRQDGEESYPAEFLYRWIKNDVPRLNRPMSSYGSTKAEQVYKDADSARIENRLPLEQALVHKEFHIEALRGQVRKLVSENAEESALLNEKVKGLQGQLVTVRTRLQAAEGDLERAEAAKAGLQREVEVLRQTVAEKTEALERNEREKSEEIDEVQRTSVSEIEALERQREALEEEIRELRQSFSEEREALQNQNAELEGGTEEVRRAFAAETETLEVQKSELEREVNELRETLVERSETLEHHKKELEEEIWELQQTFAEKIEVLDNQKKNLEEEVVELQQTLAERTADFENDRLELEHEVQELQHTLADHDLALRRKQELEEEVRVLRRILAEETQTLQGHEYKLEEEVKELQKSLAEKSAVMEGQEQVKEKALAAQKKDLETQYEKARDEDNRAATQRMEEREKSLTAQLNEKHAAELEILQKSFAKELQHIQTAHAAAVHEFLSRLERKLAASEKEREVNHLLAFLGEKLNRTRSKSNAWREKGETHIRSLYREIVSVRRPGSRGNPRNSIEQPGAIKDPGIHCSCYCTNMPVMEKV
ncbi:hypothetical protein AJ79_09767 [Helicocarpus griseus UAMH5409]|uniref:Uncharacterized protein n=1 Tax=Helicocarpus griseus UAMH5409 TaxID=1447875 RepID=A0A2B7WHB9_9EURO|nr:hypothetical protein AJ79_09767 [Helicocarpus griseus UAMH5409]